MRKELEDAENKDLDKQTQNNKYQSGNREPS